MPADPQTEGMKIVRYIDFHSNTTDPDSLCLERRMDVTDPKPADCVRLRVEITIAKKWFQPEDVDGVVRAQIGESEPHDGLAGRPEELDNPRPLTAQG